MALIADFYLETPVLRAATAAATEMDVSVEQQTLRDSKPFALTFWASGRDFEAFETGLADDPTVADVTVLARLDGQRLYQAELTDEGEAHVTYHAWADLGGVFVASNRVGDGWRTRIRFPGRESLREYVDYCERRDLTFDLRQLYDVKGPDEADFGLTARQRETLRTATEMGYFEVPRRVELEDLADELGVSRQAVSERLRRANEQLVEAVLLRDERHQHAGEHDEE